MKDFFDIVLYFWRKTKLGCIFRSRHKLSVCRVFRSEDVFLGDSVSFYDRADNGIHLMHVDTGPEKPHAEHAHRAQTPRQSKQQIIVSILLVSTRFEKFSVVHRSVLTCDWLLQLIYLSRCMQHTHQGREPL